MYEERQQIASNLPLLNKLFLFILVNRYYYNVEQNLLFCFLITGWLLSTLQADLVSLFGFFLTSRPLKSLFHTQFFFSCRQLHLSQSVIIFAISSYSCVLFSYTFSADIVQMASASFNCFIIRKYKHEQQCQLDVTLCILQYFYSEVKYRTQRNFCKLSHYIFMLCFLFCVCVCYIQCLCAPGWAGEFCQFAENACLIFPNICPDGATCIDMSHLRQQPSFQCLCPHDFTGKAYTNHVKVCSFISFKILKYRSAEFSKIRNREVFGGVITSLCFLLSALIPTQSRPNLGYF